MSSRHEKELIYTISLLTIHHRVINNNFSSFTLLELNVAIMFIYPTFLQKRPTLTDLLKIFFSMLTVTTAFLQKASGSGKIRKTVKREFYIVAIYTRPKYRSLKM